MLVGWCACATNPSLRYTGFVFFNTLPEIEKAVIMEYITAYEKHSPPHLGLTRLVPLIWWETFFPAGAPPAHPRSGGQGPQAAPHKL